MKRKIKALCLAIVVIFSALGMACNPKTNSSDSAPALPTDWREPEVNCEVSANSYSNLAKLSSKEEIAEYNKDTKTALPCENGVIVSPYYELRINGRKVPVYAARTTNGIHSFAYIDVEKELEDMPFALNT